jgi:hypothetical protein
MRRADATDTGAQDQRQGGLLGALSAAWRAFGPICCRPRAGVRAEQKRIALLLRLLLRLSERQNARGVLGLLLRVGNPHSEFACR